MKQQIKKRVIGARVTVVLVGLAVACFGVALAQEYPAAVLGGGAMWLLGQALVLAENWNLRRWKAIKREEARKL